MANKYNEKQVAIMTKTERFPARLVRTHNNVCGACRKNATTSRCPDRSEESYPG